MKLVVKWRFKKYGLGAIVNETIPDSQLLMFPLLLKSADVNGTDAIEKNMNALKALEINASRSKAQPAKYTEKPAKNVSLKYSPRHIQQPRWRFSVFL